MIVFLVVSFSASIQAEIRLANSATLDAAQELAGKKIFLGGQKMPKDSRLEKFLIVGGTLVYLRLYTPQAQATRFAAWAKENFVKLDSTNWQPKFFNEGILVKALAKSNMENIIRMNRIVCLTKAGDIVEPLWFKADSSQVSNLAGATFLLVNLKAMFPFSLFEPEQELKFYIFSNEGRGETKVKSKEIKKLK